MTEDDIEDLLLLSSKQLANMADAYLTNAHHIMDTVEPTEDACKHVFELIESAKFIRDHLDMRIAVLEAQQ